MIGAGIVVVHEDVAIAVSQSCNILAASFLEGSPRVPEHRLSFWPIVLQQRELVYKYASLRARANIEVSHMAGSLRGNPCQGLHPFRTKTWQVKATNNLMRGFPFVLQNGG